MRADADPEQGRRTGAGRHHQLGNSRLNQAVEESYKVTETMGMPENRGV